MRLTFCGILPFLLCACLELDDDGGVGPGAEEAAVGGCMLDEPGVCTDHLETLQTQEELRWLCDNYATQGLTAVFLPDGCPSEGRVARCVTEHASGATVDHFYPPNEAETVKVACEAGGHTYRPE